jgi:hypothetical protein
LLLLVTYNAILVVWMLIWSRRGTHSVGLHRHSPARGQYKYDSTRQLVAYPWLREDTARQAQTCGSVTGPVQPSAAAWGPTWPRRFFTYYKARISYPVSSQIHTTFFITADAQIDHPSQISASHNQACKHRMHRNVHHRRHTALY